MDKETNRLRDDLLAQFEPDGDKLAKYRKEVQAMLEANERTLRFQQQQARRMVIGTCFFLAGIVFTMLAYFLWDERPGVWLGFVVCFTLMCTGVEVTRYFLTRIRVEMLKEIKGLELQILELKEQLHRLP
jgi:hypothetical protein